MAQQTQPQPKSADPAPPKPADAAPEGGQLTQARLADAIKAMVEEQIGKDAPLGNAGILFALGDPMPPSLVQVALHGIAYAHNTGCLSEEGTRQIDDATPEALAALVFELVGVKRATLPAVKDHLNRKWPVKIRRSRDD